jgi:uncharacterized membrane protein YvbJ
MNCKKCGAHLEVKNIYCPKCGNRINDIEVVEIKRLNTIDYLMIGACLVAILSIFIPFEETIIFIGLGFAVISIAFAMYQATRKAHKVWAKVLIIGITTIIINLSWFKFFQIIF